MEGNGLVPDRLDGFLDPQGSVQVNHQQNPHPHQRFRIEPQQVQDVFTSGASNLQESDQLALFPDCNNQCERVKKFASGDDRANVAEQIVDRHTEGSREENESPWKRVKWTAKMVRLLITAVSYLGDGASSDFNGRGRRNLLLLPKKGKWRAISKVMVERGCQVSPQQCEDKFNDMNKKYRRLNDILGKGTSCKVVENPTLLDLTDLSDKQKEDVRKILSSKQLFYREMCSYHNGNRLYLPHDHALQRSLHSALEFKDFSELHGERPKRPDNLDEEDEDPESNDDAEEDHALHKRNGGSCVFPGVSAKRKKQGEEHKAGNFSNALNVSDCNKRSDRHPPNDDAKENHVFIDDGVREQLQNQWMMSRSLQLEEQKLQIQAQMLELEKQRLKWLSFSQKEDSELDKMRLENECLKLENVRLALELTRRN